MPPKMIPVQEDKFVKHAKVNGLIQCNFYHFLSEKESALVMFYNPECPDCIRSRPQIIRAAKMTKRDNHAFAAVDCTMEHELCQRENVRRLPSFRLYTKGRFLSERAFPLDYLRMQELIDRTLALPPIQPGQSLKDPPCPKRRRS